MNWIARLIIAVAMRRSYRKGYLYHPDGTLYMKRFGLFETRWLSARVHHLATADSDRALHDHPWSFVSVVLSGSYVENRPAEINPCFTNRPHGLQWDDEAIERCNATLRAPGSIAFRRATDRHNISVVEPNTWSLFIYGPTRQWWGFYTRTGKIYFKDYATANPERACYANEEKG